MQNDELCVAAIGLVAFDPVVIAATKEIRPIGCFSNRSPVWKFSSAASKCGRGIWGESARKTNSKSWVELSASAVITGSHLQDMCGKGRIKREGFPGTDTIRGPSHENNYLKSIEYRINLPHSVVAYISFISSSEQNCPYKTK